MKLKRILKYTAIFLGIALLIIQFIRPEKNNSADDSFHISKNYPVSTEVNAILKTACNDCHSNNTEYPWYSAIQPIGWWLAEHVEDGKKHLNLSDFLNYPLHRQFHKLEEIEEVLAENEMPLSSYTIIHRDAKLDDSQKNLLIQWSKSLCDSMESRYPADSLVKPAKK